jgi:hypothetical protein
MIPFSTECSAPENLLFFAGRTAARLPAGGLVSAGRLAAAKTGCAAFSSAWLASGTGSSGCAENTGVSSNPSSDESSAEKTTGLSGFADRRFVGG